MINVTLGEVKPQEVKKFPKLMISIMEDMPDKGIVVLFNKPSEGIVVYTPNDYTEVGYYSNCCKMDCFADYNEPITLQNA